MCSVSDTDTDSSVIQKQYYVAAVCCYQCHTYMYKNRQGSKLSTLGDAVLNNVGSGFCIADSNSLESVGLKVIDPAS